MLDTFKPPPSDETPLTRRVRLTQTTVDKFRDTDLAWGGNDCLRMFAFHLRQFGYKVPLSKYGGYSTMRGAIAALRNTHKTMAAGIESYGLQRIGYAAALPGDIYTLPGEGSDWEAITIYLGNGRALGFGDMDGREVCDIMQPLEITGAWRVEWLKR
jgi:hypothetical protein